MNRRDEMIAKIRNALKYNRKRAYAASEALERVDKRTRKRFSNVHMLGTVSCRKWGTVGGKMDTNRRAELLAEFAVDNATVLEAAGVFDSTERKYIAFPIRGMLTDYAANRTPEPTPEPKPEQSETDLPEPVTPVTEGTVKATEGQEAIWGALGIEAAVNAAMATAKDALVEQVRSEVNVTRIDVTMDGETVKIDGLAHYAFDTAVEIIKVRRLSGTHLWLGGPTGSGKSHMVRQLAKAYRVKPENICTVSATRGMSPSTFFGWLLPLGEDGRFDHFATEFIEKVEMAEPSIIFIDEVCNSPADVLTGLNALLEDGVMQLPQRIRDALLRLHETTIIIVADNTMGRGGDENYVRQKMDHSFLSRFSEVYVGYDADLERGRFGDDMPWLEACWKLRTDAAASGVREPVCPRKMALGWALRRADADKWTIERCLDRVTAGWDAQSREQCGIVAH
jgi:energy-coupling factor transporter ATP-binding protein EcfA2